MKKIEINTYYFIKQFSYIELCDLLINKTVNFISDCEFFPNFNIIGKIRKISIANNNEILFHIIVNHKELTVGSNMKNLQFRIV